MDHKPMTIEAERLGPPSRFLLLLELRAFWELGAFFASIPVLRMMPRGDGHSVLVLPGLMASDTSTRPLRAFLQDRGYVPYGWDLGRNYGPRAGIEDGMTAKLKEIADNSGRKVSVIGWSLGGLYARVLANRAPDIVRQVITLGTPFTGDPRASNAWRLYEMTSGLSVDDSRWHEALKAPITVPATSIYSRSDGIVTWQCSVERERAQAENIEVEGSHCGLGVNPAVLYAIAHRLAQPEGEWQPFRSVAMHRMLYPDPDRGRQAAFSAT
ncbi:MAG TPA: alpha/beta hydrolase [Burkholderiales bacterium]|jgi:pimeloyl-ACP methyl ester carboxylesterase|nr:alpha/beta hydrolase [Burkholderiales bacterium]